MKTLIVTQSEETLYNNISERVYINELNLLDPYSVTDPSHQQIISLNNTVNILRSFQKEGYTHILDEFNDIVNENIDRYIDNTLDHVEEIQYDTDYSIIFF